MKFVRAKDNENLAFRHVSEDGLIEIGVAPVMFGSRVRAGRVGDMGCPLDYCGGADESFVKLLFLVVKKALESFPDGNTIDWSKFPYQKRKPVYLDEDCWPSLIEMARQVGFEQELFIDGFPNLNQLRLESFNRAMSQPEGESDVSS